MEQWAVSGESTPWHVGMNDSLCPDKDPLVLFTPLAILVALDYPNNETRDQEIYVTLQYLVPLELQLLS